jgi:WhiB family redox-sensing transcriptional regulator
MKGEDAWMVDAACLGRGPDEFFPLAGDLVPAEIMALCRACLVRDECLAYALADPELIGIWAGTTGRQRQRMRKRAGMKRPRKSPDHGADAGPHKTEEAVGW